MNEKSVTELISLQKQTAIDLANLTGQFSTFLNQQQDFNKQQSEFRQRVLHYMESDPKTGTKGFIEKQDDIESRVETLEKDKSRIIGGALGVSFLVGLAWKWVSKFY